MTSSKLGIWKHGPFKTFLTRGIFRSIFKPLFFTSEEHFHSEFLTIFNEAAKKINISVLSGKTLSHWLILVPLRFFEQNFLSDENGTTFVPLLQKADKNKAVQCAHFTQAFSLWYLEQYLTNSEEFSKALGYDMNLVEDSLTQLYGMKNLTLDYLDYFREKFNLNSPETNPLDWPLVYYYDMCEMLYSSDQELYQVIGEWNDDIFQKTHFITLAVSYFNECKKTSFEIV